MPKKPKTNPNGANQYQLDPRQKMCWDYFVDPMSPTFSSGLASAKKAGYTDGTAAQITTEQWFIEKLRTLNMLEKAEKVLNDMLEIEVEEPVVGMFGPMKGLDGKDLMKRNPHFVRVKQDTAKFVAERVGKSKYSTKTETDLTSGGKPIVFIDQATAQKYGIAPSTETNSPGQPQIQDSGVRT